ELELATPGVRGRDEVREGQRAVDVGLTNAEATEVGTVEDEDAAQAAHPSGHPARPRREAQSEMARLPGAPGQMSVGAAARSGGSGPSGRVGRPPSASPSNRGSAPRLFLSRRTAPSSCSRRSPRYVTGSPAGCRTAR